MATKKGAIRKEQMHPTNLMDVPLACGIGNRYSYVISDYRHDELTIEAEFPLPVIRVIRTLNQDLEWWQKTEVMRCGNGPTFTGKNCIR